MERLHGGLWPAELSGVVLMAMPHGFALPLVRSMLSPPYGKRYNSSNNMFSVSMTHALAFVSTEQSVCVAVPPFTLYNTTIKRMLGSDAFNPDNSPFVNFITGYTTKSVRL